MNEAKLSLLEHLDELRTRLLRISVAVLLCSGAVYAFSERIFSFLAQPVGKLVFIEPQEAFLTQIRVALWGGLFLAAPIILHQVWSFVASGLREEERKYAAAFMPVSFFLFSAGVVFGYFVVTHFGISFLLSYEKTYLTPMITVSKYVSFIGNLLIAFGLVFQLPLVMFFLTQTGLITPAVFIRKRKHAIVLIFVAAAVLTPGPDPLSQIFMAVPLLILYEAGVLFSKIAARIRGKRLSAPDFGV